MRTRDIMSSPAIAVTPDASPAEAAALMARRGFTTLPVVDHAARLVGLVSEADLVRPGFPGEPPGAGDPDTGVVLGGHRTVASVMHAPAAVATPGLDAFDLARLMAEAGVRVLPVVEDGSLVGMVSFRDVLRAWPRPSS
ncbi:CBS domain-containing protein [Amycolatopsis sp. NPDC004368]